MYTMVGPKLQIPFFGSGPKHPESYPRRSSSRNSSRTLVGSPEFTYLGGIYSHPPGWPEYSGGSDHTWNSGSSSNVG
jgi:hypothetical protein